MMLGNLESIFHKTFKFRFDLDFMIIDNLEIILWLFPEALKIYILNRKALATLLPLFSIVSAFATRLLPIVILQEGSNGVQILKNSSKPRNFIQNLLNVNLVSI